MLLPFACRCHNSDSVFRILRSLSLAYNVGRILLAVPSRWRKVAIPAPLGVVHADSQVIKLLNYKCWDKIDLPYHECFKNHF